MGKVRGELEDLSFRYVDAVSFDKVQTAIDERRKEGEDFLEDVERTLQEKLKEHKIEARVEWRIKRLYSIYQKLQKQRSSVDQVYDLLAVRVITTSVQDCYAVFGLIHSHLAAGAGAHQGLHRDAAAESVSVAAHNRHGLGRPPVRGADPHRRDAPHGRRRHCRALEVQGQRRAGQQQGRAAAGLGALSWWSGSAR